MAHPLDGARAKIDRAKQNIIDLATMCERFLDKRYRHDLVGEFDPQTLDYVVNYPPIPEPPLAIAVRVGEILYLLRSSLDHIVGQLILLGQPTHSLSGCKFPICTDPGKHQASNCGEVKRIPHPAAAAIMKLQPCYGRQGPLATHALALLNALNNRDKHRLLVVLVGMSAIKRWDVQVTARGYSGFEVHFPRHGVQIPLRTQGNTPLGHVHIVPRADPAGVEVAYVKVKQKFTFTIALQDVGTAPPHVLIPLLQQLESLVFRVVRDFGRFFP